MRTPIIAGNWKMNLSVAKSIILADEIIKTLSQTKSIPSCEVVIAPQTLAVAKVVEHIATVPNSTSTPTLHVATQDVHYEDEGAFTGKIAVSMLTDLNLSYAIIGHSEQRQLFHETDETVNKKAKKLLAAKIIPIVCIGETLSERESGNLETVLKRQLEVGLMGLSAEDWNHVVIAYEPVWAIGTGVSATPEEAELAHQFVRKTLSELTSPECADTLRILYGGSVKPSNAKEILSSPNIDGALIGGASLQAESFTQIIFALA